MTTVVHRRWMPRRPGGHRCSAWYRNHQSGLWLAASQTAMMSHIFSMAPDSFADEQIVTADQRHDRLVWLLLLGLAILLFELTAEPTLSATIAFGKFGWNDWKTARWLRRRDENRFRGRVCFWFYLSSAMWKIAVAPLVALVVLALLVAFLPMNPRPPMRQAITTSLLVTGCALGLLAITSSIAVAKALWQRRRVWVHFDLHRSRRLDVWPPQVSADSYQFENRARVVLVTSMIGTLYVGGTALMAVLGPAPQDNFTRAVMSITLIAMLLGPLLIGFAYAALIRTVIARHPWECWPECQVVDALSES